MLQLKSFTEDHDRPMVPPLRGSHRSLSLRVRVCHSNTRTYVRLLGPCFKTGRCDEFRPPGSGAPRARGRITCPKASYLVPGRLRDKHPKPPEPRDPTKHAPVGARKIGDAHTSSKRFPLDGFRHSLTLFSKFFASFPHGTCSLSVSRQYLALEGIYLPLSPPVPR